MVSMRYGSGSFSRQPERWEVEVRDKSKARATILFATPPYNAANAPHC